MKLKFGEPGCDQTVLNYSGISANSKIAETDLISAIMVRPNTTGHRLLANKGIPGVFKTCY